MEVLSLSVVVVSAPVRARSKSTAFSVEKASPEETR